MIVGFFGAGFLGSWIAIQLLPLFDEFLVVDGDRVEMDNYDNALFLRSQEGRSKSVALGSLLRMMTPKPVHVWQKRIESHDDLDVIARKFDIDLGILTFDNLDSRIMVHDWAIKRGIELLEVGVTENYGLALWKEQIQHPRTEEEKRIVEERVRAVRDVCTRVQFRPLGAIMAGIVGMIVQRWLDSKEKVGFTVSITDGRVVAIGVR